MNIIEIYLKSSGSVAQLVKDFPVYVGSYKTNYVKVYVLPTMMPTQANVTYGLALSGKYTLDNGQEFVSEPVWLDALSDETIGETTYKVFGGYLPRKLSMYAGNQILILNLKSINTETGEFISVITTQECHLLIQRSAYILVDENIEPTMAEIMNAKIDENAGDIGDLETDVSNINTRIDNLPLSEDYITSFSGTTVPMSGNDVTAEMQAILTNKVETLAGREPKNGDVIIYTYQISGQTDEIYRFIYSINNTSDDGADDKWIGYKIPSTEVAGNGTLGLIEGTQGTGSTNNVIVDIQSGEIKDVKFKENGNYVSLNTIPSTYMTQSAGATKNYVRDYSLPREFNDIYYLASDGYKTSAPTSPASGIQFTATSSSVGDTTLFSCTFLNTADYELSQKNSTNNNIYIKATANATVQFRMTTQYRKNGELTWNDLSIELSGDVTFTANSLQKVQFASAMTELGDDMITMTNGDEIKQILEVITDTSDTISFEVYSSSTYPSTLNLNTQLATLVLGSLLERFEGSDYISVAENDSNTKIEIKIPDNKVENTAPQDGSTKLITSNAVYDAIPQIDGVSITRNASNKIQSSKLKNKAVKVTDNAVSTGDFNGATQLASDSQYESLKANGSIVVDGQTITYDENAVYTTPDDGGTTSIYTKAETDALLDEKLDKKPDGTHNLIDSDNKITETYLPDFVLGQLMYGGTFNASTGVATLSDNAKTKLGVVDNTILLTNDTTAITGYTANEGIFYVTSTAGTFASQSFAVGDWLLSNGSAWEKIANADAVTGVKGNAEETYRLGQVNLTPANIGSYSKAEDDALLAGKLDKVVSSDSNERVYAVDENGTQEMKNLEAGTGMSAPTHNTIPLRAGGGVVDVGTPTQAYHAANKYYVDTYGGKIDNIYVNNAQQTVTSRSVYLTVPTTTNDLTNNSGFITKAVNDLTNYYTTAQTYTKAEVLSLISDLNPVQIEIVAVLPTASAETWFNESKTIYFLRNESTSGNNYYDEYVTLRSGTEGDYTYSWECIGSTQVDLSNYVQKTFTIAGIDMQDNITKSELQTALDIYEYGLKLLPVPSSSTLTEYEYNTILTNGCMIHGTFLGIQNPVFFPPVNIGNASVWRGVCYGAKGYVSPTFWLYNINPSTKEISVYKDRIYIEFNNTSDELVFNTVSLTTRVKILNKQLPSYPTDLTKSYYLKQNSSNGNLSWRDTSEIENQKAVLTGSTAPTTSTSADFVGQIYIDTTNNKTYECTAITTEDDVTTYTWEMMIKSSDLIIQGSAQPTNSTPADFVGQLYKFTNTYNSEEWWQCVKITEEDNTKTYTWTQYISGRNVGSSWNGYISLQKVNNTQWQLIYPKAQNAGIDGRFAQGRQYSGVIDCENLNYAVTAALTDTDHITLTDEQKTTAQGVLGVNILSGDSAPTTSTVGRLGQLYLNTTNNKIYQCVEITTVSDTTTYTWVKVLLGTDNVTPYIFLRGTGSQYGLSKAYDQLWLGSATQSEINNRTDNSATDDPNVQRKAITNINVDYAVKQVLTDPKITMTDAQKVLAQTWIGVNVIVGNSAPTTSTVGALGQFYIDTTSGSEAMYVCLVADTANSTYTWKQVTLT